ncbi:unnamed protein product [Candidula unifasciata]|uniref:Uncharacterized protein n=1 Tax=Candidula unifasciata TaxID=100452 RepID=A0A8S3ZYD6_9EUPU|nr:unnamed protein product [Candidula unifasciata]
MIPSKTHLVPDFKQMEVKNTDSRIPENNGMQGLGLAQYVDNTHRHRAKSTSTGQNIIHNVSPLDTTRFKHFSLSHTRQLGPTVEELQPSAKAAFTDYTCHSTRDHTSQPTRDHTSHPTRDHTSHPTRDHTSHPTRDHTSHPTRDHTFHPTRDLTSHPTMDHTSHLTGDHTSHPTRDHTSHLSRDHTSQPTRDHTSHSTRDHTS